MKEAVLKLKDRLQISYFLIGRVRTTEQFSGCPFHVKVTTINPGLNEVSFNFKIKNYNEYTLSYFVNGIEVIKPGVFDKELVDTDLNILVTREANFNRNTAEQLASLNYSIIIHDLSNLIFQYQQSLAVQNPEYTNVLVLTLDDVLPERAVLILDSLSRVYINKSLNSRFELNERTITFIDKQLDEVSASLKQTEDTMENYKRQRAILDMDFEKQDLLGKLSDFDKQKSKLHLKIDALNDLEKYIIEDRDPQFLPPNVYLVDNDAFLITSVNELYSSQIKLNQSLGFSKEVNPNIIEIRQGLKQLKQTKQNLQSFAILL